MLKMNTEHLRENPNEEEIYYPKILKGFNYFYKYAFIKPLRWQRGNCKEGECFI